MSKEAAKDGSAHHLLPETPSPEGLGSSPSFHAEHSVLYPL
jgi:hypothetical protein